ncbi:helix-turn-helix transcriptional regulator [Paenibacillus sp. JSM ZJ436]|uniref:helix-turn-helix transcriptional regulator n=1 Tax=Paenibacillus sp. JSM ZJ436 TaxID=3376190 RepID=UPI0037B137A8
MDKDSFILNHVIYASDGMYDHNQIYDYAKDANGTLYKPSYGWDGLSDNNDITAFRFINDEGYEDIVDFNDRERESMIYYRAVDRVGGNNMPEIRFADNLKRYRENLGLTKEELARRLGVTGATVGHWESGKYDPRLSKLKHIADALGITTYELLFNKE